jgi:hypothetical protein
MTKIRAISGKRKKIIFFERLEVLGRISIGMANRV